MDSLVYNELKEITRYLIDCVLEESNHCQYVTVANVFTLNDDFICLMFKIANILVHYSHEHCITHWILPPAL